VVLAISSPVVASWVVFGSEAIFLAVVCRLKQYESGRWDTRFARREQS
jgi:hypothetical protein